MLKQSDGKVTEKRKSGENKTYSHFLKLLNSLPTNFHHTDETEMPTIIKALEKAIEEQSRHVEGLTSSIKFAHNLILGIFVITGLAMCAMHKVPNVSIDLVLMTIETILLVLIFYINQRINGYEKFHSQKLYLTHVMNVAVFLGIQSMWFVRTRSTCTRCWN